MPLVTCPTCKKEISDKAPACPNCGEPMASSVEKAQGGAVNMSDPVHVTGMVLAGVILLSVVIYAASALG